MASTAGSIVATATDGLVGWSTGFRFTMGRGAEREIRQGGNHTLAAFAQAGQAGTVCLVVDKLAKFIPDPFTKTVINVLTNVVPILSVPLAIFCGTVRDRGIYPAFAFGVNTYLWTGLQLPARVEDMSPWVVAVIDFTADHAGAIMQGAIVVGSIALIALGSYVLGGCILGALIYQVLDEDLGVIPRKVSLFMETYMPIISWVGILIAGNVVLQTLAVCTLITYIPGVFPFFMEKMDYYVCKRLRDIGAELPGASLKEIHAPLVENKEPSYQKIIAILDGNDSAFEINPAHCSKPIIDIACLPKDRTFDKLLTLFDRIDWTQRYPVVSGKLKDDDRFMDFLVKRFPTIKKSALKKEFDSYVNRLAEKEKITQKQFVANWVRTQMKDGLIPVLKGERRVEGRQQDLDDAITSCAMLLPYLEGLGESDRIDFEDTLLSLAIEGGFYCGRGAKRIASELVRKLLYKTLPEHAENTGSPDRDYELKVRQALQDTRAEIVEAKYRWLTQSLHLPDVVADDVHGHDIYRQFLCMGFFPLTPHEQQNMNTASHLLWEMYHHLEVYQPEMMREYQEGLDATIHAQGDVYFGGYIRRIINANRNLTQKQKEALIERYSNIAFSSFGATQEMHRFRRLMLVMLGVLRPRQYTDAAAARPAVAAPADGDRPRRRLAAMQQSALRRYDKIT